jgi:hypothetical protein
MVNIQRESHIQNIHVHVHVVRVGLLSIADARVIALTAPSSKIRHKKSGNEMPSISIIVQLIYVRI